LFTDELYFLSCGEHLSWGYVDLPPLTALQAWTARALFGDSMLAIRLIPALAGVGLVLLTGAIVRQLEGGRFAQILGAVAVLVAPFYLAFDSYLSMNSIEPLLWMGCALILIRMIKTGDTKLWIWFGVVAGIGLENKDTMAMFGFALLAGLMMTPQRRLMASRWPFIGGMIAFLIFLPNLLWMIQHHFPHLEMLANIRRNRRNVAFSPLGFMGQQVLGMQPMALPIWICGLWAFLFSDQGRPYKALGIAYLVTLLILFLTDGRFYYLAPAYPMLLAGGAVTIERWLTSPRWRWMRTTYLGLLAVTGGLTALIILPLLPPKAYISYTHFIGISQPKFENRKASELPQLLADRMGWPEMATAVARVYNSLPADERARTAIFAQNYGEAGAIDFYGPKLGLPKAISGHASFWLWGPREYTGESMIVIGDVPRERLEQNYARVEARGSVADRFAMASEHFSIYLCSEPKGGWTLAQQWPKVKNWN
jgi:4-amino-4-deoxy-L-arabinose transferase-like glycosyltransferase